MSFKPTLRVLMIAALTTALAAGCARTPHALQAGLPVARGGAVHAMANPVSLDALAIAHQWDDEAAQVGVSIVSAQDGDDVATYMFAAPSKQDAMLIVAATDAGLKAQVIPMAARAADGLARVVPLTGLENKLLDSKVIFRMAAAAGLEQPDNLAVLNTLDHDRDRPVAVVTSHDGLEFVVLDAMSGKALSAVTRLADRRVQMHELAVVVGVVAVVGTVAVVAAKKLIAKYWKPKPKPSGEPSPAPSAEPSESPNPVLTPPPTIKIGRASR